ncbi:MAG: hypothetical protein MMC33_005699 [Icmadophila ericetorum]|nr:hypothetical protein [Icmadophila ericetorum]
MGLRLVGRFRSLIGPKLAKRPAHTCFAEKNPTLCNLPGAILAIITDYLPISSEACLVCTCKQLYCYGKTYPDFSACIVLVFNKITSMTLRPNILIVPRVNTAQGRLLFQLQVAKSIELATAGKVQMDQAQDSAESYAMVLPMMHRVDEAWKSGSLSDPIEESVKYAAAYITPLKLNLQSGYRRVATAGLKCLTGETWAQRQTHQSEYGRPIISEFHHSAISDTVLIGVSGKALKPRSSTPICATRHIVPFIYMCFLCLRIVGSLETQIGPRLTFLLNRANERLMVWR